MSFKTVLLLIASIAITSNAQAAEWFYRPFVDDNYCKSNICNGTSYETAWRLDDSQVGTRPGAVDWAQIKPGDVLYVCGLHEAGFRDRRITPIVSGTDQQPIVIDGDCPKFSGATDPQDFDQGTLFAVGRRLTGGWNGPDQFGVYWQDYGGNTQHQVIEDRVLRLKRETKLPDTSWQPGSFYQEKQPEPLYYKPSSGIASDHTVYTAVGGGIRIKGVNYIHVKNLTVKNASTAKGMIGIDNAQSIRIENCNLQWAGDVAITIQNNSDNGQIIGNTIHDVANGIYFYSTKTADNSDNWLVARNQVFNVNQDYYYSSGDSHAIGIQGGSGNIFEYNHLHHIGGSGMTFFTFKLQEQKNNIVRYNYVHDVEDLGGGGRSERGIEHGNANNDDPEATSNNMVYYNIVANVKQEAFRVKGIKRQSGYTWSFLNNVVYNAGTSFAWNEWPMGDPGFRAQNNIFMNPTGLHISQQLYQGSDNHSGIVMTHNLYYPEKGFQWANVTYGNLADWQTASGKGQNSLVADPRFVDPANADFHLNPSSLAADAGVAIEFGPTFQGDFVGNPVVNPPNIGAYEARAETRPMSPILRVE